MAVTIDPAKTGTSDEVNPTFASLTVSGPVTLTGGTANGVAYLNGSKVLTTGSALTFDGSTVTVGTSAANYAVLVNGLASGSNSGAAVIAQNGGVPIIAIGNKSSLLGGAYSPTPMLFALAPIEINQSIAVTGSISATGLVTANTLRVNVTPTAEVVVATHTAVFNINGTNYKFLCLAA